MGAGEGGQHWLWFVSNHAQRNKQKGINYSFPIPLSPLSFFLFYLVLGGETEEEEVVVGYRVGKRRTHKVAKTTSRV